MASLMSAMYAILSIVAVAYLVWDAFDRDRQEGAEAVHRQLLMLFRSVFRKEG